MESKRRVLYLDTAPTVGGSVVSLYQLLRELDRDTYEPVVLTCTNHAYVDRFRALGARVIVWDVYRRGNHRPAWLQSAARSAPAHSMERLPGFKSVYHGLGLALLLARTVWPRARAIARVIEDERVDLVHTNIRVGHDREGIVAAWLAGVPCICHVRHHELLNVLDRRLAQRARCLIYISQSVQASHLCSGILAKAGVVIHNGVDAAAFAAAPDQVTARRTLGLALDVPLIGMVGRLESWKGHAILLQALAAVQASVPSIQTVIAGDMVPHEPDLLIDLEQLCRELGLGNQVQFQGFVEDIPMLMSALDVLVLPSVEPEPFGRVLIEAMAAGKPVVASDAGAAREIVTPGEEGLLVPSGDATALAEALTRLSNDPTAARAMGQKGRARVKAQFSTTRVAQRVQAIYERVLARR